MSEEPEKKLSDMFVAMARKIDHNDAKDFGGAFVIVPPAGAGEPLQGLMLNNGTDLAAFWIMLQGMVNKTLEDMKQNQNNPYGIRR